MLRVAGRPHHRRLRQRRRAIFSTGHPRCVPLDMFADPTTAASMPSQINGLGFTAPRVPSMPLFAVNADATGTCQLASDRPYRSRSATEWRRQSVSQIADPIAASGDSADFNFQRPTAITVSNEGYAELDPPAALETGPASISSKAEPRLGAWWTYSTVSALNSPGSCGALYSAHFRTYVRWYVFHGLPCPPSIARVVLGQPKPLRRSAIHATSARPQILVWSPSAWPDRRFDRRIRRYRQAELRTKGTNPLLQLGDGEGPSRAAIVLLAAGRGGISVTGHFSNNLRGSRHSHRWCRVGIIRGATGRVRLARRPEPAVLQLISTVLERPHPVRRRHQTRNLGTCPPPPASTCDPRMPCPPNVGRFGLPRRTWLAFYTSTAERESRARNLRSRSPC